MSRNTAGFTLIELMIVVAVLAVLAAVATPTFIAYRDKGRVGQVIGTSEAIRAALASYAASDPNNVYPSTGTITNVPTLRTLINDNGGSMPSVVVFALSNYAFYDSDGDGIADTYSMRLSVNGVPNTLPGAHILLTPQGIYKCTASGSPC